MPALLLIVLLAVTAFAYSANAQDDTTTDEVLYFNEQTDFGRPRDRFNFTTYPPTSDDSGGERQMDQGDFGDFVARQSWYLPLAPGNWSVSGGDTWTLVFYMSGLNEVLPLPSSLMEVNDTGGHRIQVDVRSGDTHYGSGSIELLAVEVEEGVQEYRITITFDDNFQFSVSNDSAVHMTFLISVTGRGADTQSPLFIQYGNEMNPSRLIAPDYPFDAFQTLEDLHLKEQECLEKRLEQEACKENGPGNIPGGPNETTNESEDDVETIPTPAIGFVPMVAALLWLTNRFRATS